MLKRLACLSALVLTLCTAAVASPEQWIEVRSAHFTVLSNSNEKQARRILDQFERMRWMFQTLFPKSNVDPIQPIVIFAAKDQQTFAALEPPAYLAKGQLKLAGYFLPTMDKIFVLLRLDANYDHPFATIYHEYTHLQLRTDGEWIPLWLNEGLAEFFQNTEIRNKDVLLGEPSLDDILYLRQHQIIPLDVLFKVDAASPYYHEEQKGSVFYSESWALTHYLEVTDREKNTHRMRDYMALMSQHQDSVTAAETAFGDLKMLQKELQAYIRAGRYMQFVISSAAAPIDESTCKVRSLTQTESDTDRAEVLVSIQRMADAKALLASVLKADPNNAKAHETMGFLELQAGHRDAAQQWFEQAVKLDSQSYLAHYYFAALSMGQPGAEQNKQIETSLRTAIQLNPRFARAYDQLATFYAMKHENLQEAHMLNLQAIQLDPGNLGYRMNLANVSLVMGQYPNAVAVLQSSANLAKTPEQEAMIQSRIAEIQQIQQVQMARAQASAAAAAQPNVPTMHGMVVVETPPKHPTMPSTGPRHAAVGVIRGVTCSYPSVIEFRVESPQKAISVYNNDFFKVDLTLLGFTQEEGIDPCKDFEGMKARVQYVDSSDKTVDGQAVAVELRK